MKMQQQKLKHYWGLFWWIFVEVRSEAMLLKTMEGNEDDMYLEENMIFIIYSLYKYACVDI